MWCSDWGYLIAQPPGESLLQSARKEALTDCHTLDSGGELRISPWLWESGPSLQVC